MVVSELRALLDGQTHDAEILIDGADNDGLQIWLEPLGVKPRGGVITILANETEKP